MRTEQDIGGRPRSTGGRGLLACLTLVLLLTAACGADDAGLRALQAEPAVDLRMLGPGLEQSLTEVRRIEREGGETLGKPVRPEVSVVYAVDGGPDEGLDLLADELEQDGWSLDPVSGTLAGPILAASRSTTEGQVDLSVVATDDEGVSGIDGPVLIQNLVLNR